jgi:hypothetical protein
VLKTGFLKERVDSMSEPDILSRKIGELKDWQTVAWRRIADPSVTRFERREIRNHIKQSDDVLRQYLAMMSERVRFRARAMEDVGDIFTKLRFRLLCIERVEHPQAATAGTSAS